VTQYQFAALLLAVIGPALAVARLLRMPASLTLFGAGLGSAYLPGLPAIPVDPQLVLNLFLPPLIYASTVRVSWHLLRISLLPGVVLGAGLVLATIGLVALATYTVMLPGLSLTGALLLGAIAAVFDTRLFHEAEGRPRVPRAIADTLKARELVSRPLILATLALVVEATILGRIGAGAVGEAYILDIAGGLAVGIVVGHAVARARQRIDPAAIEIAVSVATPFTAALSATAFGFSGVAAVTAAALVVSAIRIDRRTGVPISSPETRINATAFWEEASLMVSSALLFLAGRALPEALEGLGDWPIWRLATTAAGLLVVVLTVQAAFAYVATGMRPIAPALAGREGGRVSARLAAAAVMAWSSTRSVIGLVIALSLPQTLPNGQPFPERDLILTVSALCIVGSVVLQGLTLGWAVERAALSDAKEAQREGDVAREAMARALGASDPGSPESFAEARRQLVRLRENDRIGDEVLTGMLRETDLVARASEGNALPGAGPPNP
jgi:CPA1 family monovalent cation:H+ antiporter